MIRLFIIGAGRHAAEVYSYIQDLKAEGKKIDIVGLVDDNRPAGSWQDTEVMGNFGAFKNFLDKYKNTKFHYITAVGDNKIRKDFVRRIDSFKLRNISAFTLIHPSVNIGKDVYIGEGSLVAAGSVLTTNIKVGKHCIINVKSSISHDCNIGDFVNINPGAVVCGNVNIAEGSFIGAGATVINRINISSWSTIGAGAVVIEDISSHTTVAGVPARKIHYKK